ncbi:hypothetical protein D3C80_1581150 [compost metagenome]
MQLTSVFEQTSIDLSSSVIAVLSLVVAAWRAVDPSAEILAMYGVPVLLNSPTKYRVLPTNFKSLTLPSGYAVSEVTTLIQALSILLYSQTFTHLGASTADEIGKSKSPAKKILSVEKY